MENNKQQRVECIPARETVQEFYGCVNDTCPVCGEKFITPANMQKVGNVIYHLTCHLAVRDNIL